MNKSFVVGDKVEVRDFFGRLICKTEVTDAGNIRTEACKGLFNPDGSERKKSMFWTDRIYISKLQEQ